MKDKLVVIIGPTGVGKTKISIELAKASSGEIISGDSMQIYRGMDIGTAKISRKEMEGIPHYLIDIKDPQETFSVADFQASAQAYIKEINRKGKLPFIVGGTGLYIQSVLFNYNFSESSSDPQYRESLEQLALTKGEKYLYDLLVNIDPAQAKTIHPNNVRRVIRALEVHHVTGRRMSETQNEEKEETPYQYVLIGLTMERKMLYDRINQRVDMMIEQGLIQEVKSLYEQGVLGIQSSQGIGYKEIVTYIRGEVTRDEAIEQLKQNSRRYAKRQLTWFRNKMDVTWFDMSDLDYDKKVHEILRFLAGKLK